MTRAVLCAATQLFPAAARISHGVAPLRIAPSNVGKPPPEPVLPPVALDPPLPTPLEPPVGSEPPLPELPPEKDEQETAPVPRDRTAPRATDDTRRARLFFIPGGLRLDRFGAIASGGGAGYFP
jgi:hypothetical protein